MVRGSRIQESRPPPTHARRISTGPRSTDRAWLGRYASAVAVAPQVVHASSCGSILSVVINWPAEVATGRLLGPPRAGRRTVHRGATVTMIRVPISSLATGTVNTYAVNAST